MHHVPHSLHGHLESASQEPGGQQGEHDLAQNKLGRQNLPSNHKEGVWPLRATLRDLLRTMKLEKDNPGVQGRTLDSQIHFPTETGSKGTINLKHNRSH